MHLCVYFLSLFLIELWFWGLSNYIMVAETKPLILRVCQHPVENNITVAELFSRKE